MIETESVRKKMSNPNSIYSATRNSGADGLLKWFYTVCKVYHRWILLIDVEKTSTEWQFNKNA